MIYSIFIPHLPKEIDKHRIQLELSYHLLGEITKIDIVSSHHKWNNFFIHYSTWNNQNPIAVDIKNKLDDGYACNLFIISSNTYWKILKNTSTIHTSESSWELIKNPFEMNLSKPLLLKESQSTSSLFDSLSLFERMSGNNTSIKTTTNNSNDNIDALEKRIKKLEDFIYYHTNK
jgi:hypothetical protein